jgi:hypothetical protein
VCEATVFSFRPSAQEQRTMKTKDDIETPSQQELANYFNAAVGYYELGMLDEAEIELRRIDACVAAQSVPVLSLKLAISYCRSDWKEMKAIARKLFLLEPSNPRWPFADGFATGKIEAF